MKERPILFSGEMVRSILEGRKTQTRRVMKVQPPSDRYQQLHIMASTNTRQVGKGHWAVLNAEKTSVIESDKRYFSCPYGRPGDRLWVREAFQYGLCTESTFAYRATHKPSDLEEGWDERIKWRPSIHMPRWASRINLEITGVRVERLQDISEEDALAEGVTVNQNTHQAVHQFCRLWRDINGQDSWAESPWVWVIEFKRVRP